MMRANGDIKSLVFSAVSSPTPGIVISRRHALDALAIRLMSASIATTAESTAARAATLLIGQHEALGEEMRATERFQAAQRKIGEAQG
jgi:hypothetical protein